MKKRGFTLAEVMVALTLVGIVASLTIPTFISNSRNKSNVAKLSTIVSSVENAFTNMIAAEGVQGLSETQFGRAANQNQRLASLSNYIKLSGGGNMNTYYRNDNPFRTIAPEQVVNGIVYTDVFQAKNGAILAIDYDYNDIDPADLNGLNYTITTKFGYITIDVNGASRPNVWARDAFYFAIGDDGILYPCGSSNFSILDSMNNNNWRNAAGGILDCNNNIKSVGCTARLIEENYEINY